MYGIFTHIWLKFMVNVGKYTVRPMDPSWVREWKNETRVKKNSRLRKDPWPWDIWPMEVKDEYEVTSDSKPESVHTDRKP